MVAARADGGARDPAGARVRPPVLCDRYTDSTLAYRAPGGGSSRHSCRVEPRRDRGTRPDLTLLFDLDPERGLARRAAATERPNRLDREPLPFHTRVRSRYLELAAAEPARFRVVDAALDPGALEERVWEAFRTGTAGAPERRPGSATLC